MAVDKDTIELMRKWLTTAIVIIIVPISGLWMGYNKLQILQEVQAQYLLQRSYAADRAEFGAKMENLSVKVDAILQHSAAQEEHLRAIETRVEKK